MWTKRRGAIAALVLGLVVANGGAASAEASVKDGPEGEGRKFSWSASVSGVSEYVFRGFAASQEEPTVQAWLTLNYGIAYATVWASGADFGNDAQGEAIQNKEIDYYVGIKPAVGPITFDLGALFYTYPGAHDDNTAGVDEQDSFELKAAANVTPVANLALGGVVYWTPDYTGQLGEVWTVEGNAGYTLPAIGIFTPTISGTLGAAFADNDNVFAPGEDQYTYWNAGLTLAVQKFAFDFRYWDTTIDLGTFDERFVFAATLTLP
jgi:uncharacterized protein (TIGR02001 family)